MTTNNDYLAAIDRYHELLHQTPNDIGLILNLAWSYERVGQYAESVQQFRRALDLNEKSFDAYYGLGLALMGSGASRDALTAFKKSRELAMSESVDRSEMVMISKQVDVYINRLGGRKG